MRAASIAEVAALYDRWGADHYDETISQLAHAEQTAALARHAGAPDALIAAALLHDVGHLLDLAAGRHGRHGRHESSGARYLSALFPPAVTQPIVLHVEAKRYLCATQPGYAARLSAGSTASLTRQGGPMSSREAAAFAGRPGFADAVRLRGWDDEAKVDDAEIPAFAEYEHLLESVVVTSTTALPARPR